RSITLQQCTDTVYDGSGCDAHRLQGALGPLCLVKRDNVAFTLGHLTIPLLVKQRLEFTRLPSAKACERVRSQFSVLVRLNLLLPRRLSSRCEVCRPVPG